MFNCNNTTIYTITEIMNEIDVAIKNKEPFSLIRLGDGGLKLIYSILYNDTIQIKKISKKEGIPYSKFVDVFELWGYYLRRSNFIDSSEVYFTNKFWDRLRDERLGVSKKTTKKLKEWKTLYYNAEIDHERFCNPETNYLSCLESKNPNLIDIITNRNVCIISTHNIDKLRRFIPICKHIDTIKIVGQYDDHYNKCYNDVVDKLNRLSTKYDLFLVAAGELGRIYSGIIKENGGRSFDIGFMVDYWCKENNLHPRLLKFIQPGSSNLTISLTNIGYRYNQFI